MLHQFLRYVVVGGIAFAVDFGSLYLLTELAGIHYLVSALIAFVLGLIVNYLLSKSWVFDRRSMNDAATEFLVFAAIGVVGLGLNEMILWILSGKMHIHYMAGKAVSAGIVLVWNFGARRRALFSSRPLPCGLHGLLMASRASALLAIVAAAFLVFCLAVQGSTGAWPAGFDSYPDEASHFVGAVMIHDWLLSVRWLEPVAFARDYYDHFPFFAVGYWPPAFHLLTGILFLVAGVGRIQALLVPAIFAAGTAWLIFLLVRPRAGLLAASCAGALYLSLPAVQRAMCAVMVDHMTTFLCLAAGVCLLRYLKAPGFWNAALFAIASAGAILSKYSGAYLVVLPMAAILALRRNRLLREPSFVAQPFLIALLVGPWLLLSSRLAFYGLPDQRAQFTANRALSFVAEAFGVFPPPLMVVVILGLIALLALPRFWREDLVVTALLCAGHLALLALSPVGPEKRYLLAPAACLLVLSFAGWTALLSFLPVRFASAVPILAGLTASFAVVHFGQYERPRQNQIRPVVEFVLKNEAWTGARILMPPDMEGPFIAEFLSLKPAERSYYLVRPSKLLASMDWFGERYSSLFRTTEEQLEYFRNRPVNLVISHECSATPPRPHESMLRDMLRSNPSIFRDVATFGSIGAGSCPWIVSRYAPDVSR